MLIYMYPKRLGSVRGIVLNMNLLSLVNVNYVINLHGKQFVFGNDKDCKVAMS